MKRTYLGCFTRNRTAGRTNTYLTELCHSAPFLRYNSTQPAIPDTQSSPRKTKRQVLALKQKINLGRVPFDSSVPRHFPQLSSIELPTSSVAVTYAIRIKRKKDETPEEKVRNEHKMATLAETKGERLKEKAKRLAEQLNLPYVDDASTKQYLHYIEVTNRGVQVVHLQGGIMRTDFAEGQAYYRSKRERNQRTPLAKAIGITPQLAGKLKVVDCTGGLGEDAFLMASLGCMVTIVERNPIVFAVLQDAYKRGLRAKIPAMENIKLIYGDAKDYLASLPEEERPHVAYIDAMYPVPKKKKSLVKIKMRILRTVVGDDADANDLVLIAKKVARERVVIKRPKYVKDDPLASRTFRSPKIRWEVLDVHNPVSILPPPLGLLEKEAELS